MLETIPADGKYCIATMSGTAAEKDGALTAQASPSRAVNASSNPALK
jgi:hypothetical protein